MEKYALIGVVRMHIVDAAVAGDLIGCWVGTYRYLSWGRAAWSISRQQLAFRQKNENTVNYSGSSTHECVD